MKVTESYHLSKGEKQTNKQTNKKTVQEKETMCRRDNDEFEK